MTTRAKVLWVAGLVLAGVAVNVAWQQELAAERKSLEAYRRGIIPIGYVSTRGHLQDGVVDEGHTEYDYSVVGVVPGVSPGIAAPSELMIVEHGLNNTAIKAEHRFGIAKEALARNGYSGAVIGFSWDGSTNLDPWGATGYHRAKHNANANGKKLAQFIADYKSRNPNTKIRLIGYSMGARVALDCVYELAYDAKFAALPWRIDSVHLVGASIKNEDVQTDDRYGRAIEARVAQFFNYYSPKDSKLGKYFRILEMDNALGRTDIEHPDRKPVNYFSHNVSLELPAVTDEDEIDPTGEPGRNHSGYLGTRNSRGELVDDGVMNVVLGDIGSQMPMQLHRRSARP